MGKGKRAKAVIAERVAVPEVFDYPLSGSSEELHALLSGWINVSSNGLDGVTEASAMGIPAFSRGVELIAGTIAGLPLKTYTGDGSARVEVPSFLDDPVGPYALSRFNWQEMQLLHLVIYREANLLLLKNGAGALQGYFPIHPQNVSKVEWTAQGSKRFHVRDAAGTTRIYGTPEDPTDDGAIRQVLGPSTDGLRGTSLLSSHRRIFQIAIAAEKASARTFTGALVAGLVTTAPDEDVEPDEAQAIMEQLNSRIAGVDNAGRLAFINRHLQLQSWQMSNLDAQFNESRAFQIEEFARMLGLMPVHLAQTEKQTSWGTGISEQNLGLARFTFMSYTSRLEAAYKMDLPDDTFAEFDYKGLLQGTPKDEIGLLIQEKQADLIDKNEARAVMNLPPQDDTIQPKPTPIGGPVNG